MKILKQTVPEFICDLEDMIDNDYGGNQAKAAEAWGCSRSHLNAVLKVRILPGEALLNAHDAGIEHKVSIGRFVSD